MMLKADSSIFEAGGACQVVLLQLMDIGVELSAFLRRQSTGQA